MKDNKKVKNQFKKGFTLIELVVVISILGILLSLAMLSYSGLRGKAIAVVCKHNLRLMNQGYESFIEENSLENNVFAQETFFKNEYEHSDKIICPIYGDISYISGEFRCEVHTTKAENDSDDDKVDEVPYL